MQCRPLCLPQEPEDAAHGPLETRARTFTALMMLLCAYPGYAAGMGLGRFVVGCQDLVGMAKPTPRMQYGISAGDLVLQSTTCLAGTTGTGDVDAWDLNSGSCTGTPPLLVCI